MINRVSPCTSPPSAPDATEPDFLTLRDGSTVQVHVAGPGDCEALTDFFRRLSPESRWRRFLSLALPRPELVASLCDGSDPRSGSTLLATRVQDGEPRVIASGSYLAKDRRTAEVAIAVADGFQGKGLGTLLLERLALSAVRHGFTHFWAVARAENQAMLEVLRESGFALTERPERSEVEVDLTLVPTEAALARLEMRHRVATVASLSRFFRPHSVAVVGASRKPTAIGHQLLDALVRGEFRGAIYPVNPKADMIEGLRAYPSVRQLPQPVELAVIAVPREAVLGVVDDCAARGIRAVVVISAGFAEVGREGAELQKRLLEKVHGYGMRLVGPNCVGLLSTDPDVRLHATFVPYFPPRGGVAMSSDSGALGLATLAVAGRVGLGISDCVSVGNRADVSSNDLLEYWEEDDAARVILLYLESFGNPRRFARIARRVGRRKPIIAVKAGRTGAGRRAAGSHTAALAAADVAVDALFHQTGILRAETLEEMFDLAAALDSQPLPPGRRVAIVTNAGGPAILCADACEDAGLLVPELSAQTRQQLAAFLPRTAGLANPVDMIAAATPEDFGRTIRTVLASAEVDALIAIAVSTGTCEAGAAARAIAESAEAAHEGGAAGKPVLVCLMPEQAGLGLTASGKEKIPCYAFPEAAARVLGKAAAYAEWRGRPLGRVPDFPDMDLSSAQALCEGRLAKGGGWLSTEETRLVLQAVHLPVAPGGVARTAEEAAALARRLGFPVAVKLASRRLTHKTEIGGVRLGLTDEAAVRRAFEEIQDRLAALRSLDAMEGVLVQPMVSGGTEVLVGMTHDPLFGPLLAFALGGIHVEILGDVCFRVTPLTERDAFEMVSGIRGSRLFAGYRGHPPADVAALEELLLRVSQLVEEVPEIDELDLNPVFALPPGQGCRIVDARIGLKPTEKMLLALPGVALAPKTATDRGRSSGSSEDRGALMPCPEKNRAVDPAS
jgi:acetyl coenzyme A synthetase (ADP forming)-like protein